MVEICNNYSQTLILMNGLDFFGWDLVSRLMIAARDDPNVSAPRLGFAQLNSLRVISYQRSHEHTGMCLKIRIRSIFLAPMRACFSKPSHVTVLRFFSFQAAGFFCSHALDPWEPRHQPNFGKFVHWCLKVFTQHYFWLCSEQTSTNAVLY